MTEIVLTFSNPNYSACNSHGPCTFLASGPASPALVLCCSCQYIIWLHSAWHVLFQGAHWSCYHNVEAGANKNSLGLLLIGLHSNQGPTDRFYFVNVLQHSWELVTHRRSGMLCGAHSSLASQEGNFMLSLYHMGMCGCQRHAGA